MWSSDFMMIKCTWLCSALQFPAKYEMTPFCFPMDSWLLALYLASCHGFCIDVRHFHSSFFCFFFWVIGFLVGYSATQSSNQCRAVIRNSNRHPGVTRLILGAHNCDFSESKNQFITTDLKTNWKCQMTNDCLSNCQLFTDSLMEPSDLCGFWNNCN
jgi:hypothetical protein